MLPVPLPAECAGTAAPGQPILGLSISVNPVEVGEMLLGTDARSAAVGSLPRGIYDAPMNDALYDCAFRLIDALRDPDDRKVLAPMIKREIVYRVLKGEKGEILQALILGSRRFFRIARVLQRIHASPEDDFDVENLAKELNMSSSTFHSSFKAVTDTSPLQYIKSVRLHKARKLMLQEGLNAGAAAIHVGYESTSQFNREYKRLFGVTPGRDASAV